jgi:hypothetical protein
LFGEIASSGNSPPTDLSTIDSGTERTNKQIATQKDPREHRISRVARAEAFFSTLSADTEWDKSTSEKLSSQIEEFSKKKGGRPVIEYLECRGGSVCRIVLEYSSFELAMQNADDILSGRLLMWEGAGFSSAFENGSTPTKQLLFLYKQKN